MYEIDSGESLGLDTLVDLVPVQMAYDADEISKCTTAGGIMSITTLDDKLVNGGKLGPITKKV
ncbi:uncharacterized protein N7469_011544 [Penicillium citrinum]|uniref:Uncharacterized protein n=2 Tax=Penicillium TaxID=5073 RepID=A0A9W9TBT5_PENCI|nr:uncharacterized protein N7469_011544 [Penicillium citrinum]KAJ5216679.1 hypothetical protein N7469_011544 [Penicillium citrinum]KAJ5600974.1 hypothetical protein N7450_002041 [Penicillium hetheringtonii]KAK5807736.1 hypothetical protein VI817_001994 [Penicillium citrinum]